MAIQPDHLHLFVQADPRHAPYQIAHAFKGRSSRILRKEYSRLLKLLSLWARSYFVSTAGKLSQEIVQKYIEDQS